MKHFDPFPSPIPILLVATPVVFALHNLEEITMGLPHYARTQGTLEWIMGYTGDRVFGLAIGLLTISVATIATLTLTRRSQFWLQIMVVTVAALGANAVSHLVASLRGDGYTPGVATALVLVAPLVVAWYRALVVTGYLSGGRLALLTAAGAILMVPLALASLALSDLVLRIGVWH